MSYILDALKKSESERQRQNAPGFADVPAHARGHQVPKWMWMLGALLLINAAVLSVLVLRDNVTDNADRTSLSIREPETSTPEIIQPAVPQPAQGNAIAQQPARTVAARPQPAPETSQPDPAEAMTAEPAREVAVPPRPRPVATTPAAADTSQLPSLMELRTSGRIQLPELHLDIHVYSGAPKDRFVFINMSKYREQSRLKEGPLLTEIRQDGVVLDYQGSKFLLPRE